MMMQYLWLLWDSYYLVLGETVPVLGPRTPLNLKWQGWEAHIPQISRSGDKGALLFLPFGFWIHIVSLLGTRCPISCRLHM